MAEQLSGLSVLVPSKNIFNARQPGGDISLGSQWQRREQWLFSSCWATGSLPHGQRPWDSLVRNTICQKPLPPCHVLCIFSCAHFFFCASFEVHAGATKLLGHYKINGMWRRERKKRAVRVQGFPRQKYRFSSTQWQLLHECVVYVHYSLDAGQSSPEKYHFLTAHLLQDPYLGSFKSKFQFHVRWETFLLSSTGENKKKRQAAALCFWKFPTK